MHTSSHALHRATGSGRSSGATGVLAGLVLGVAVLAGCGSGGEPAQNAAQAQEQEQARIDACALLTKAEVEAALGSSVAEPRRTERDGYAQGAPARVTQCHFDGSGLYDGVVVTIRQFEASAAGSALTSEEFAADIARQFEDPAIETRPGVQAVNIPGHAAAATIYDEFAILEVRQGGIRRVQLSITAPSLEIARRLVDTALPRLP